MQQRDAMVVHGSGDTMALLQASATGRGVAVEITDDLHDISVQGPRALAVLSAACSVDLAPIGYFRHVAAQ